MKMRLRKKYFVFKNRKYIFIKKLIIVFIMLIMVIIFCLKYISDKATPTLLKVGEIEATKLSNIIVNYSIGKELENNDYLDKIFVTASSNDNNIKTIDLNSAIMNKLLLSIVTSISNNLKKIESGDIDEINKNRETLASYDISKMKKGIIYEITSGALFDNALIANIGPKIPIKISLVGNITGKINTKLTDYGINNALVEISAHIVMEEMVILPITSKKIVIENDYVIATRLIQGNIPNYYFENKNNPTLTVPVE